MLERVPFDYSIIRVVPRVERGEGVNAGVVVFCRSRRFLEARINLDRPRLLALDAAIDCDDVEAHLRAILQICHGGRNTGPIGALPQPDRWYWLVAPRSTIIQPSLVHSGLCVDPTTTLNRLAARYL